MKGSCMAGKQLDVVVEMFRAHLLDQGWSIVEEKDLQNGLQLLVTDGMTKVPIDCYTNGNALIQGPAGVLKTELQTWWKQQKASPSAPVLQDGVVPPSLRTTVEKFRTFALSQGWSIAGRAIHNGIYQFRFTSGNTSTLINFYPSETVLIQGNPNEMRSTLEHWWQQQQAEQAPPTLWDRPISVSEQSIENTSSSSPASSPKETKVMAHIGTDEAGKGDYFGPLVVAGVFVDEDSASRLLALGVRDSKQLSDVKILSLAEEIKKICHGHGHIVAYRPERYNQLYQEMLNLNLLLATAHAQVIASLQERTASRLALVDQFSHEPLVLAALQKMNCEIAVEQRPRAEDDIAVAAASIIARATFVRQIEELSQSIGVQLPKGASSTMIVTVGREIVARAGRDALGKVAKLHFKTTQEILQH